MVDVNGIRRRRRRFVPIERGIYPRDDRPSVRVGGRFAREVPGVELGEGGVEVVGVEPDTATIRSSASISMMQSASVWKSSGRWSCPRSGHE